MALAVALLVAVLGQEVVGLTGRVVDATGRPLAGAALTIGTKAGTLVAVSGEDGSFAIPDPTARTRLVVSLPGFATSEITLTTETTSPILITLRMPIVEEMVYVSAPVTADTSAALPLTPLDVVRTPGTQADLMRALGGLPGVAKIDEGAGLFVRGGDVGELVVLLDGVVVGHPYRYETPTGGFRGAIDPFLIQGASFSAGGFSAAYGNSLSAIVDLVGPSRPTIPQLNVTAGLAGVAFLGSLPLGSKWGIRGGANRTTPSVLFAVNPSPRAFDRLPGGWDLSGSVHGDLGRFGRVRLFALQQSDHVGVELEKDAFVGFLHSNGDHRLLALKWERGLGRAWQVNASAGSDVYASRTDVGILDVTERERNRSGRVEVSGAAASWNFQAGGDFDVKTTDVSGRVPLRGGDFGGVSGLSDFEIVHDDRVGGVFTVASRRFGSVTPEIGARADRYEKSDAWTADPRLALRISLDASRQIRVAWGRYHQGPSPNYFDRLRGAGRLPPLEATHFIVGYERGRPNGRAFMRAEAFYKRYSSLPLQDDANGFVADGYGSARGFDYYFRGAAAGVEVTFTASLLHARRRWTSADARDRYDLPPGTWAPDFAIPYRWQLVANVPIARGLSAAMAWRVAAGRPTTPAIGATPTPFGYEPIWGPINSDRLPRYERLDLSTSLIRRAGKAIVIVFASVDNVFGRDNFFEYAYSADYSERRPVIGAAPRSFYVGCSVTR